MPSGSDKELRAALEDAEEIGRGLVQEPGQGQPRVIDGETVDPGGWLNMADEYGMPPECPVTPLGTDALRFFFLTTNGQVVSVPDLKAETIKKIFAGRVNYIYWAWPRWKAPKPDEPWEVNGWDAQKAADALYDACSHKGVWRDFDLIRGRGMWRDDHGKLILHCGDVLFQLDRGELIAKRPGDYTDEYGAGAVYPAGARTPFPWRVAVETDPAEQVLDLFKQWTWRRDIDARLLLGWVVCAIMAGALDWRPSAFVTGASGSGKSTLLKDVLKALLGSRSIYVTNVTAAGLYQHIQQDAPAVVIDQFEAGANPARAKAVIELVRDAASEGLTLRGGADHKGVEFSARNCTLFGAVRRPAMRPEDLSRTVFLQLDPLPADAELPDLNPARLHEMGRKLVRRIMDRWDQYFDLLGTWHDHLMRVGHSSRGADQFGALLAASHMVLFDEAPAKEELAEITQQLAPSGMVEFEGQMPDWERCLNHMLSAPVNAWRSGTQSSVGELLTAFIEQLDNPEAHQDIFSATNAAGVLKQANKQLATAGLKIEAAKRDLPRVTWWLAVPTSDEKLRELFKESDFAGESGVEGAWGGALQQAPRWTEETPAGLWVSRRSRLDGRQRRCTWLNLCAILAEEPEDGVEGEDVPF